jgi:uncharacterized protein YjbJ (UPF0337 family)
MRGFRGDTDFSRIHVFRSRLRQPPGVIRNRQQSSSTDGTLQTNSDQTCVNKIRQTTDARLRRGTPIRPPTFPDHTPRERKEPNMDKDRIKGVAEQAKGKVKEQAGKLSGDKKLETEGKVDKAEGKVRNTVGGMKDTLRDN